MLNVGVGTSTHRNPAEAGKEALTRALAQAGVETCDFVMMFATVGYDQAALLKAVRAASGGAKVSGCLGEGILAAGETNESSHAVACLAWKSDTLRFANVKTMNVGEDSRAAGERIGKALAPLPADAKAIFVFADNLNFNFLEFEKGFQATAQPSSFVPMVGGYAGDNWKMKKMVVYHDDEVLTDSLSVAVLHGEGAEFHCGVTHGCVPIGHARTITRSEGATIYEIDGKPVLDVLKEYLSEDEIREFLISSTANLCLGFNAPPAMAGEYDELVVRFIPFKDEAKGSVTIPEAVKDGMPVWMTRRDAEKMLKGAEILAQRTKDKLAGRKPKVIFQFDCASRGKAVLAESEKTRLVKRLQELLGEDVPWLGFYSYGEIGPVNRQNFFHTNTAIVSALY